MPSLAVSTAVAARLAGFTGAPVIPENTGGLAPADGQAFVTVEYPVATERPASIGAPGANRWREEGAIRFVVCVPRGAGLGAALTLADTLRALFRNARFDGVRTYEASPATTDDTAGGNYHVVTCAVAYDFDIIA